jgi:hypothetical protein
MSVTWGFKPILPSLPTVIMNSSVTSGAIAMLNDTERVSLLNIPSWALGMRMWLLSGSLHLDGPRTLKAQHIDIKTIPSCSDTFSLICTNFQIDKHTRKLNNFLNYSSSCCLDTISKIIRQYPLLHLIPIVGLYFAWFEMQLLIETSLHWKASYLALISYKSLVHVFL